MVAAFSCFQCPCGSFANRVASLESSHRAEQRDRYGGFLPGQLGSSKFQMLALLPLKIGFGIQILAFLPKKNWI